VNQTGEFLLDDLDSFRYDSVGTEGTGCLDIVVEAVRDRIVIEWFAFRGRLFPIDVLAWWPVGSE